MKHYARSRVLAALILAAFAFPTLAHADVAVGLPPVPIQKSKCAEYTLSQHRVLLGEFQIPTPCDVQPPQILDLHMSSIKVNGLTPRERCDHAGGSFKVRAVHSRGQNLRVLRCMDVDY